MKISCPISHLFCLISHLFIAQSRTFFAQSCTFLMCISCPIPHLFCPILHLSCQTISLGNGSYYWQCLVGSMGYLKTLNTKRIPVPGWNQTKQETSTYADTGSRMEPKKQETVFKFLSP